ncbi:MAG: YncE family protein [Thermomicrobiales bacterium]
MRVSLMLVLLLAPGLIGWGLPDPGDRHEVRQVAAQSAPMPEACFAQTGKCVRGLFYAYWAANGALERQGFPITDEIDEVDPGSGKTFRVQYFERSRFEYHQELVNTPFVVLLGAIGRQEFAAHFPQGRTPTGTGQGGGGCFAETGYCISPGAFLDYWQRTGGLAQHGYPISDEFAEKLEDGNTYQVQYFERARFEYHPEYVGTPSVVLLGRLGVQQFAARYPGGQPAAQTTPAINVWAGTIGGMHPNVANIPPRVYVPDELRGDITVIDPLTFKIIDRYPSGVTAHHVGPNPGMTKLYVNNMGSNNLLEIDAQTGKPIRTVFAAVPYNLYFTTDGTKAIVAAEPNNRLDFYDPVSWRVIKSVPMGCSGVDHLDMSADGRYLLVSCEFDGQVIKVDTVAMAIIGRMSVGGLPVDVKLSPDGSVFYIANQGRHGVSIIDPVSMRELDFLRTGQGAHGLAISRDTKSLYVANRLAGTISTIDFASGQIVNTWFIGGSPDMLQVSPDGTQLWASGRFNGAVYVVDTTNGTLMATIPTGTAPHGLAYFPQPGQISIGHNGVYR